MEDARRDQVEDEMLLSDLDGVASVVAAVEAGHDLDLLREQVHDLSLAFVAPLGADHNDIRHSTAKLAAEPNSLRRGRGGGF